MTLIYLLFVLFKRNGVKYQPQSITQYHVQLEKNMLESKKAYITSDETSHWILNVCYDNVCK
jgi:hypothetical protein